MDKTMEKEKTLTAAIYVRSSSPGEKRETLDNQAKRCKQKAKGEGYTIPADYILIDSGVSGSTMNRPGFNKIMELAEEGKIQAVIVYKLNRFARNFIKSYEALKTIVKLGVVLIVQDTGWKFDGSKPSNMIFGILGLVNEWTLEDTLATSLHNKEEAISKGKVPQSNMKFGWKRLGKDEGRKVVVDERAREILRQAKKWIITLGSTDKAAEMLPKVEKKNKKTGKMEMKPVLSGSSLRRIFSDDDYWTGKYHFEWGGETREVDAPKIFTKAEIDQVRKYIKSGVRNIDETVHLLHKKIFCSVPECDRDLQSLNHVRGPMYQHQCNEIGRSKTLNIDKSKIHERAIDLMKKHFEKSGQEKVKDFRKRVTERRACMAEIDAKIDDVKGQIEKVNRDLGKFASEAMARVENNQAVAEIFKGPIEAKIQERKKLENTIKALEEEKKISKEHIDRAYEMEEKLIKQAETSLTDLEYLSLLGNHSVGYNWLENPPRGKVTIETDWFAVSENDYAS